MSAALVFVVSALLGAGVLALVRVAVAPRCTCQRDDPLAGLGALGAVTDRVRRADASRARGPTARAPSPHPPSVRHPHRGATPCP